jgi:hypothetical protein
MIVAFVRLSEWVPNLGRAKTNTGDPFPDQARVPPGDQAARFAAAPSK